MRGRLGEVISTRKAQRFEPSLEAGEKEMPEFLRSVGRRKAGLEEPQRFRNEFQLIRQGCAFLNPVDLDWEGFLFIPCTECAPEKPTTRGMLVT